MKGTYDKNAASTLVSSDILWSTLDILWSASECFLMRADASWRELMRADESGVSPTNSRCRYRKIKVDIRPEIQYYRRL
jgi:hypothetical protein